MADELLPQTLAETDDAELEDEEQADPRLELMREMLEDQRRSNADLVKAVTQRAAPPAGRGRRDFGRTARDDRRRSP